MTTSAKSENGVLAGASVSFLGTPLGEEAEQRRAETDDVEEDEEGRSRVSFLKKQEPATRRCSVIMLHIVLEISSPHFKKSENVVDFTYSEVNTTIVAKSLEQKQDNCNRLKQ